MSAAVHFVHCRCFSCKLQVSSDKRKTNRQGRQEEKERQGIFDTHKYIIEQKFGHVN
jgi:hypothetical protein